MGSLPQLKKVMIASELSSLCNRVRIVVSLEAFALNCCIPKTLSKVVLGSVSSAMASVTNYGNDNLPIFLIVGKDAFEAITQVVKVRFF